MTNSYQTGFLKQAMRYGYSKADALSLFKLAEGAKVNQSVQAAPYKPKSGFTGYAAPAVAPAIGTPTTSASQKPMGASGRTGTPPLGAKNYPSNPAVASKRAPLNKVSNWSDVNTQIPAGQAGGRNYGADNWSGTSLQPGSPHKPTVEHKDTSGVFGAPNMGDMGKGVKNTTMGQYGQGVWDMAKSVGGSGLSGWSTGTMVAGPIGGTIGGIGGMAYGVGKPIYDEFKTPTRNPNDNLNYDNVDHTSDAFTQIAQAAGYELSDKELAKRTTPKSSTPQVAKQTPLPAQTFKTTPMMA